MDRQTYIPKTQGKLFVHKGYFKGFKEYSAYIHTETKALVLIKDSKTKNKIVSLFVRQINSQNAIRVYSLKCENDDQFIIVDELQKIKHRYKAETSSHKIQWMRAINEFTKNLNEHLQIILYPSFDIGSQKIEDIKDNQSREQGQSSMNAIQFKSGTQLARDFEDFKNNDDFIQQISELEQSNQNIINQLNDHDQNDLEPQNLFNMLKKQQLLIQKIKKNLENQINSNQTQIEEKKEEEDFQFGDENESQQTFQNRDDSLSIPELFQSIIEHKLVVENHSNQEMFGKSIFQDNVNLEDPLTFVNLGKVLDNQNIRLQLPSENNFKISAGTILKLLKDIIGKDLSKFSMPVWVNEPESGCQKGGEFIFYSAHFLELASKISDDSCLRMAYIAMSQASVFYQVIGRIHKPFNPLLGETYELVSSNFRYFNEIVSHHPPVCVFECQGKNFKYFKQMEHTQKFNGKVVNVIDRKPSKVLLKIEQNDDQFTEQYEIYQVPLVVGNLIFGDRYIEPHGSCKISNKSNGDSCELIYRPRDSWKTKEEDKHFFSGFVKDKDGSERYKIWGKYSDKVYLENLATGEQKIIFQAPKLLEPTQDKQKIYQMNMVAFQVNYLSENLKAKLPPTDSRLRPDVRAWENGHMEEASKQKDRLEVNQRKRRQETKKIFEEKQKQSQEFNDFKIDDERTFYNPRYWIKKKVFDDKGNADYEYVPDGNKYWEERDKAQWTNAPKIYEDDCQAFF